MARCRGCGEAIDFVRLRSGKLMPVESREPEAYQVWLQDPARLDAAVTRGVDEFARLLLVLQDGEVLSVCVGRLSAGRRAPDPGAWPRADLRVRESFRAMPECAGVSAGRAMSTAADRLSYRWKARGSSRATNAWPEGVRTLRCLGCGGSFVSRQRDERLCVRCRAEDEMPAEDRRAAWRQRLP